MDEVLLCDDCPDSAVCEMYEEYEECYFGYTEEDLRGFSL